MTAILARSGETTIVIDGDQFILTRGSTSAFISREDVVAGFLNRRDPGWAHWTWDVETAETALAVCEIASGRVAT
jgi:hypothetical protein